MKTPYDHLLGHTVMDGATGYTGVCDQVTEHQDGMVQVSVQPKSENGRDMPQAYSMDPHHIQVVPDGAYFAPQPVAEPFTLPLGSKVRDTVTGFVGTYNALHTYINGCQRARVISRYRRIKDDIGELTIPVSRLELVQPAKPLLERLGELRRRLAPAQAPAPAPVQAPVAEAPARRAGGPMTRSVRP